MKRFGAKRMTYALSLVPIISSIAVTIPAFTYIGGDWHGALGFAGFAFVTGYLTFFVAFPCLWLFAMLEGVIKRGQFYEELLVKNHGWGRQEVQDAYMLTLGLEKGARR